MKYGICSLSIIPQRATPQDEAEMVNQLLFGDLFTIIETQSQWRKVKLISDGYMGWIDEKQMTELSFDEFQELKKAKQSVFQDNFGKAFILASDKEIQIYKGTSFYFNDSNEALYARTSGKVDSIKPSTSALIKYAKSFLTTPYLWGGRSVLGIDCSGFTQIVFKILGYHLFRDTPEQEAQGELVSFDNKKPGDVAFFSNKNGKVMHVGILLENNKIIHASGEIRIDSFSKKGIYNEEKQLQTHHLHSIKRLFLRSI